MQGPLQRETMKDFLEATPSIVFLALWRSGFDMQLAGWIGTALAACVLVGFHRFRVHNNPIMLGINVHLLIITPLIIAAFHLGARELSDTIVAHSYRGVLVTILLVGCALTLFSHNGFLGIEETPKATRQAQSAILLAASAATVVWAFTYNGGGLFAVAVPVVLLFSLRRLLIARASVNRNKLGGLVAVGAGSALASVAGGDGI